MRMSREATNQDTYDVEVRDLVHWYGRTKVIDNINLKVRQGEFFSILGPSGSGKTTTLRIIGGFVFPTSGSVYIQNELMDTRPPYERNTTMVFQQLALFPHKTVFENLAYGLKIRRRPKAEIIERVTKTLRLVKLEGFDRRYPKQLSGGQQQRVALARSIILEPGVVLFDEPLGSLDLKLRREMQVELKNLQKVVGTTFVYVTHDQEEALTMSNRIAVMNEGRIEQIGTAEEVYEKPETKFVADFIGDTNLIDGKVSANNGQVTTVQADGLTFLVKEEKRLAKDDAVTLSIRPEKVSLATEAELETLDNTYLATVQDVIYTGSNRRLVVGLENGLILKIDSPSGTSAGLAVGDKVWVGWPSSDAYALK
jgi:spermidine/putrescine transport system ATP-binding protein